MQLTRGASGWGFDILNMEILWIMSDLSVSLQALERSRSQLPVSNYFDAETYGLVRIDWKGQQFVFSQPKDFDGTRVPTHCVLYGKDGKERMRTDLRSITRLAQLPAGLPAPK